MKKKYTLLRKSILSGFLFVLSCQTDSTSKEPKPEISPISSIAAGSPLPMDLCQAKLKAVPLPRSYAINTSNPGKIEDFKKIMGTLGYKVHSFLGEDLPEIVSTELAVVAHKASQFSNYVLVEDSSLKVEGANIGINVRWLIDHLPKYIGHKAELTALIAFRVDDVVFVYEGKIPGKLVSPRGPLKRGFRINQFFQPTGSSKTLAESSPLKANPRFLALRAMKEANLYACTRVFDGWDGEWQ